MKEYIIVTEKNLYTFVILINVKAFSTPWLSRSGIMAKSDRKYDIIATTPGLSSDDIPHQSHAVMT